MQANKEEVTDEDEDDWYLRRMEAGLAALQTADYVLAWVCMEDDGVSQLHPHLERSVVPTNRLHRRETTPRLSSRGNLSH